MNIENLKISEWNSIKTFITLDFALEVKIKKLQKLRLELQKQRLELQMNKVVEQL